MKLEKCLLKYITNKVNFSQIKLSFVEFVYSIKFENAVPVSTFHCKIIIMKKEE